MRPDSSYVVVIHKKFQKTLEKNLPTDLKKVFNRKLEYLAANPLHPSLNTKQYSVSRAKLRELEVDEVWEFYINMSFRCVFYLVHEEKLMILAYVGDHTEVKNRYK
ncbi:MAG: hypothetical protein UX60_C0014G0005 [Berkelbacteria bacterium GW2011_GWA2_46_7]|uniref:Plasmid stabilization system n=1 Tax=Berkelbacteria bacterium GW2011_GWA2_46_7 TaxID=1618335 RepID=A0A0G1QFX7_9BACT|nr:MAG: hypothetical protein UX60_C0014G0005 [Berkelbacteria bacterium GW2011_GWA2_46_7]